MTSPDPTTGDGFFNGLGGLADFSTKTQEDWENERKSDMLDLVNPLEGFGGFVRSLIEWAGGVIHDGIVVLQDLAARVLTWVKNAIANVLELFSGVPFIGDAIGGLADLLRGTENKAVAAHETAMTAVDDAATAAALAAANEAANIANSTALAEANMALGTKAEAGDIPKNVPGYVTLNPIEDAVFPASELVPIPVISRGNRTSAENNGNPHSHLVEIEWAQPVYTAALNRLDIAYINATRARIYNTVGFTIAEQDIAPGSRANMIVSIFKMGKNAQGFPNGEITRIWNSGSTIAATIPAGFTKEADDIRLNLGTDINAAPGDWYGHCIFQYGAGKTPRNLLGKQMAKKNAVSGVYPTRLAMTFAGDGTLPLTLTPAQLDNASTWIPWMFMGQSLGLIKINLVDLFDRANAATLGSNWAVYMAGMDIVNGVARCRRNFYGLWKTRVADYTQAVYVSQLATDSTAASGKIDAFDRSHDNIEDNPRAQVAVRCNSDMTRYTAVGIRHGMVEIRSYSDANPGGKTQNSTLRTWAAGDIVEIRVTDAPDGTSTYIVSVDNGVTKTDVLDWWDRYNESSRGAAFRRAGFETANVQRAGLGLYSWSIPSVGINEWKARDLV